MIITMVRRLKNHSQPGLGPGHETATMGRLRPVRGLFMGWLLILLAATAALAGDGGPGPPPAFVYPHVFRYAVLNLLSGVNPKDAKVAVEMDLLRYYKGQLPDVSIEFEFLADRKKTLQILQERKLHGISLSGVDFLYMKDKAPIRPIFVTSKTDRPTESYVLVTPAKTSLESLSKSPQRRLVTENIGDQSIGLIWLDTILLDKGYGVGTEFFTAIRHAEKPARMVLPVFFGQAEACLVPESAFDTMSELNPQISKRLKVLLRSPGFVRTVNCLLDNLHPDFFTTMEKNALHMKDTVEGRQMAMIFHVNGAFMYDPKYLKETQRICKRYRQMMSVRNRDERHTYGQK
jgi:ABC-type phosphate/phosphonate transport system substrate-binding protein